jgi:hypothetical protein
VAENGRYWVHHGTSPNGQSLRCPLGVDFVSAVIRRPYGRRTVQIASSIGRSAVTELIFMGFHELATRYKVRGT